MKKFVLVLFIFFLLFTVYAERVAELPQLIKPNAICVDNSRVYITQEKKVFVYTLDPFKLKTRFGKKGEGPGEFKWNPHGQSDGF